MCIATPIFKSKSDTSHLPKLHEQQKKSTTAWVDFLCLWFPLICHSKINSLLAVDLVYSGYPKVTAQVADRPSVLE